MSVKMTRGFKSNNSVTKEINITYPSAKTFNLVSSPIPITDTTEPSTPNWSFTIENSDFPTLDVETSNIFFTPSLALWFSIKNVSGTDATLSYRILINDSSVYTSSRTVTANNHLNAYIRDSDFNGVEIGDTIKILLWASTASVLEEVAVAIYIVLNNFYFFPSLSIPATNVVLTSAPLFAFGSEFSGYTLSENITRFQPIKDATSFANNTTGHSFLYVLPDTSSGFFFLGGITPSYVSSTGPNNIFYRPLYKIRWEEFLK